NATIMPGSFATVSVPLVDNTAPNWSTQSFSITSGSAVFKCTCPYVIPAAFGGASCAYAGCASTHANAAMTNDLITRTSGGYHTRSRRVHEHVVTKGCFADGPRPQRVPHAPFEREFDLRHISGSSIAGCPRRLNKEEGMAMNELEM